MGPYFFLKISSDLKFSVSVSTWKNSDWVPLTTLSHCKSLKTMTAISRYMELTIEPVQQASVHGPQVGVQKGRKPSWKAS
jgi:hypothetical protein